MASSSNDSTTGAPEFADADAPDLAVNPTEVAAFAASVGTRLIGDTAARTAYAYAREGLEWYDTTTDAIYVHNGSGWKLWHKNWAAYTPTLTNMSGSPTVTARYAVASGVVFVRLAIALNGANFGTTPKVSLPVTAATVMTYERVGESTYADDSAGPTLVDGAVYIDTTTTAYLATKTVSGSYVSVASAVTATLPFTWASGDTATARFNYEAA